MERPAEYVMILFPLCDLSLTPDVHGQEVPFHCLFGLAFVRLRCIWTSLPCSAPPLNSCLSGRQHGVCASVIISCFHKMERFVQKCFVRLRTHHFV